MILTVNTYRWAGPRGRDEAVAAQWRPDRPPRVLWLGPMPHLGLLDRGGRLHITDNQ